MKTPAIIYLILTGINLMASSYLHGKPRLGNYNVLATILSTITEILLLKWGGFFN